MKRNRFYVLLGVIILIAVVGTTLVYYSYNIYDVKRVKMSIIVFDHYGFSVDTDHLEFGMNIPGGGGNSRTMYLVHGYKEPLLVQIERRGEMGSWTNFDNNFILEPNVGKNLTVSVNVPPNVGYGNYTGELVIIFKKNF